MLAGKRTQALAASDSVSEEDRTAIRAALTPMVEQLQHDVALIRRALDGPDPEFALFLAVETVEAAPAQMRTLEAALSVSTGLRLVA